MFLRSYSFVWKAWLLALVLSVQAVFLHAQENQSDGGSSQGGSESAGNGGSAAPSQQSSSANSALQVSPPSATLPTPPLPLPPPLQEATPSPSPSENQSQPTPPTVAPPEFNPPTAETLNLPSAQPAGNPEFAPASVGMPSIKLDDSNPGDGVTGSGPGLLGGMFDWANKLRFNAAVRSGYDNNVNSANTNAFGSWFGNLNGGVNYRFGAPRLNVNATLTGGITLYQNPPPNQRTQGTIGLGVSTEYRYTPRLILTFNTSSSYQQQPNPSLIGSSQNQNGSYIFTANSFSGAYQWSDLFTTITRLSFTSMFYLDNILNTGGQGFNQPAFSQSFRWLVKPTTTAVLDYNTDYYGYAQQGNSSWGQSLSAGCDHTFNPQWFWNFRAGAEFRTYQNNANGSGTSGTYIGPYVTSNLSWALGKTSSINWTARVGTQPSGQSNVSFSPAARSGLNYSQGITAKLKANAGIFYLIQNYKNAAYGPVQDGKAGLIDYNQQSIQGNASLSYELNRIFQISTGYQYMTSTTSGGSATSGQEYNRGISYLQLNGAF